MKSRAPILTLAAIALSAAPAFALFDVKTPLAKIYDTQSQSVYVGTISALDPDSHVLTLTPFSTYKGDKPDADSLKIQITAPDSLPPQIKIGQPAVIFQAPPDSNGRKIAVFHLADHWYAGDVLAKPGTFRITRPLGRPFQTDHDDTFPGKTPALIKALDELKAGKSTLLDTFPEKLFPDPVKETFTLPKNASAFAAFIAEGVDGPFFAVVTADGLKILHPSGSGSLADVTANCGLNGLKPTRVTAFSQADELALLIDSDLYTFDGNLKDFTTATRNGIPFQKTWRLNLPNEKILALAIDDLSDDGQPALAILTPKDLLRISLGSIPILNLPTSMPASQPAPAPLIIDNAQRLTAKSLLSFHPEQKTGLGDSASLISIELNHDHRPDLLILTPTGTLTLLNRGFGGFLVNKDQAAPLLDPAHTGKPELPLLASTPETLYLLQKDGALYRYNFPNK